MNRAEPRRPRVWLVLALVWIGIGWLAPILVGESPLLARVDGRWQSPAWSELRGQSVAARPPTGYGTWSEWDAEIGGDAAWFPLWRQSPTKVQFDQRLRPPCWEHPLGTDGSGRDLLARTIHGLGRAAWVGVGSALVAIALGLMVGGLGGWLGSWPGRVIQWLLDWSVGLPPLLVAMVAVGFLGGAGRLGLILLLGLLATGGVARLIRGEIAHQRRQAYVEAAAGCGISAPRIVCFHLLASLRPLLAVQAALVMSAAIVAESTLAFLGVASADSVSLGGILSEGRETMHLAWHPWVIPATAVVLIVWSSHACADRWAEDPVGER